MRKHLAIIIVLVASVVTHFAFFSEPRETVFDEVHFGKFMAAYFTGEYYFDIHPPLGKLIISGAGYMAGFQPGFSFGNIGDQFPDNTYLALRFLPRLAGTLLPVVIFLLLLELGLSRVAAMSAGLLIVLENALLVQSRFMLLDSFLLLFGFTAWWLYARYRNHPHVLYLLGAAIFAGSAASIKWTGITFLGIIGILELLKWRLPRGKAGWKNLIILAVIPFLVYYSLFTIHFRLLSKPGPGDAFMTQEFRDGKENTWQKFVELNKEMYRANANLTATHPYSSKWYTWPFMQRPIYYWNDGDAKIYLLGNPIVWWASTVGIIALLINAFVVRHNKLYWLIAGAYLVNLLPFIGIDRAMFLYHYFTALVIAIIALVYLIDQQQKSRKYIFGGLLAISLVAFLVYAPLTYGLPAHYVQSLMLRTWQ